MKSVFFFVVFLLSAAAAVNAVPAISSPSDGVEIIKGQSTVQFSFSGTSGGSYVELWIDNNSGFGSPEVGYDNGASSDYTGSNGIVSASSNFKLTVSLQNALPQNLYYAKARLLDSGKEPAGGWGATISFSLLDWKIAPNITYPVNRKEFTKGDAGITFNVSGTSGADKVELWIDNNSGFGSPEIGYDNGAGTPWIRDGIFLVGNSFVLSVKDQEKLGQNLYYAKARLISYQKTPVSGWSDVAEFVLLNPTEKVDCQIYSLSKIQINSDYQTKNGNIIFSISDESCDWSASSNVSWISVSPSSGTGNGSISYAISENTAEASRQGKISISSDEDNQEISVFQEGAPGVLDPADLVLLSSFWELENSGGQKEMLIKNAGEEILVWGVFGLPSWLTISSSSGSINSGGSFSVSLTAVANTAIAERTAELVFKNFNDSQDKETFSVSQAAAEEVKTKPVAEIISITPAESEEGEKVSFSGKGSDEDGGEISAYQWLSDLDGILSTEKDFSISSLSVGTHVISFKVRDDESEWSDVVTMIISVKEPEKEIVKAFDCSNDFSVELGTKLDDDQQCPAYMRMETGIDIYGDAYTWWEKAKVKNYPTGSCPAVSSIIIFSKVEGGNLQYGHVGKIVSIEGDYVWIRDANWLCDRIVRFHRVDLNNCKISGYIYCGYTIPECGSGSGEEFKFPDFFVDSLRVSAAGKENDSAVSIGDSIVLSAETGNILGVLAFEFKILKDGESFFSCQKSFDADDEFLPNHNISCGKTIDSPGEYSFLLAAENRGAKYEFTEKREISGPSTEACLRNSALKTNFLIRKGGILFYMVKAGQADLRIFNCRGRLVGKFSGWYSAGKHEFPIRKLSSGAYFVKISIAGGFEKHGKMFVY